MSTDDSSPLVTFLTKIINQKRCSPSQLAAELGVCHSTVSRWLHRQATPGVDSCRKLSEYTGLSLPTVLSGIGYTPLPPDSSPDFWPEFREYASQKYPTELDDDLVTLIEDLIALRRNRIRSVKSTDIKTTRLNSRNSNSDRPVL